MKEKILRISLVVLICIAVVGVSIPIIKGLIGSDKKTKCLDNLIEAGLALNLLYYDDLTLEDNKEKAELLINQFEISDVNFLGDKINVSYEGDSITLSCDKHKHEFNLKYDDLGLNLYRLRNYPNVLKQYFKLGYEINSTQFETKDNLDCVRQALSVIDVPINESYSFKLKGVKDQLGQYNLFYTVSDVKNIKEGVDFSCRRVQLDPLGNASPYDGIAQTKLISVRGRTYFIINTWEQVTEPVSV